MNRKERPARALALISAFALISASFAPEAWAQAVPLVEGLSAPVGASASAAFEGASAAESLPAVRMPSAASLTASPSAAPSHLLPASYSAAPSAVQAVQAPLSAAAEPFRPEQGDAANPTAQAPAVAPAEAETGLESRPSAGRAGSLLARRFAELKSFFGAGRNAGTAASPVPERKDTRTYWDAHKDVLLSQTQSLKDRLDEFAARRERKIGEEEFAKELAKSRIALKDPALGKAEMTVVDGQRFVRVVHAPTELSFLFLSADAVSRDSAHLRQIIARQFFDAGSDRADGRRGRNPVAVWQKDGSTVETEFHQKPAFPSGGWWRQYWRATYKAPTVDSLRFGLFMGVLQGLLSWGVAMLNHSLSGTAVSLAPIAFTSVFGTLIGTYMSFYRNWTYRGSALSQLLKSSLISIAFAYPVIIFTKGFASLTLMSNALTLFNVGLNNTGKVAWQSIPKMYEKYKHYQSNRRVFGNFKVGDLLNQGTYLINWTLRLIALLIPTWVGYAPLLAGIGIGMGVSYWYAKRHHYSEAAQMLEKPRRLLQRLRDALRLRSR